MRDDLKDVRVCQFYNRQLYQVSISRPSSCAPGMDVCLRRRVSDLHARQGRVRRVHHPSFRFKVNGTDTAAEISVTHGRCHLAGSCEPRPARLLSINCPVSCAKHDYLSQYEINAVTSLCLKLSLTLERHEIERKAAGESLARSRKGPLASNHYSVMLWPQQSVG